MPDDDGVALQLTRAEALVLFEWLASSDEAQMLFNDKAERIVLWNIECQLERTLVEPLESNYAELLAAARDLVRSAPEIRRR